MPETFSCILDPSLTVNPPARVDYPIDLCISVLSWELRRSCIPTRAAHWAQGEQTDKHLVLILSVF